MHDAATLALVDALLREDGKVSRNKHFEAFKDPRTRRAFSLYRRLFQLALDLAGAPAQGLTVTVDVEARRGAPGRRVTFVGPRLRRTTWVDERAWALVEARVARHAA